MDQMLHSDGVFVTIAYLFNEIFILKADYAEDECKVLRLMPSGKWEDTGRVVKNFYYWPWSAMSWVMCESIRKTGDYPAFYQRDINESVQHMLMETEEQFSKRGIEMMSRSLVSKKTVYWEDLSVGDKVYIPGDLVHAQPTRCYGPHKVHDISKQQLKDKNGVIFHERFDYLFVEIESSEDIASEKGK